MGIMKTKFKNANEAYNYFHDQIIRVGVDFADTRALFNIGFTLMEPLQNEIHNKERKWSLRYAEAEWLWYLSANPSIKALGDIYGKIPAIWKRMADGEGNVNSNYGWQIIRNDQMKKVVDLIKANPDTRQAAVSIYDGKEIDKYKTDTPCTYAIQFTVLNDRLNMCVTMRSNDLWYGFCNDQFCFSELQRYVAEATGYKIGEYYHFAHNLHLYNNKI
jgi:thymidylate synthase